MYFSTALIAAVGPLAVLAAPSATHASEFGRLMKRDVNFNFENPPVYDVSKATIPTVSAASSTPSPSQLPAPSDDLELKHVAVGTGTQNYTCASAAATPVAVGALATLYNFTYVAATSPKLLALAPNYALQFDIPPTLKDLATKMTSGHHYFLDATTAFFNLDTVEQDYGTIACKKVDSVPAPADAVKGKGYVGDGAVAWLRLNYTNTATGDFTQVYRVNTAGGNPPKTCAGQPAAFQVPYAAEYWLYAPKPKSS